MIEKRSERNGYKFKQGAIQRDVQGGFTRDEVVGDHTEGVFIWRTYMCYRAIADGYLYLGLSKDNASMSVSITLIFLSALLTGLGWYDRIAKHAGAGTLVPITGFANSVAAPALEFKTEGYILGLGAKIFIISGPVILYGTLASVLYGLIYYLFLR